jgi:hypothetical protein
MANDRSMERLERLRETPLFKVTAWELDWHNAAHRPQVANRMTWLGFTDHDAPIRKAFKFFNLDERDPRHWRILITYLAMGFFPNPKKGGKNSLKTILANDELLKRANYVLDTVFKKRARASVSDTELLKEVVKAHPRDYSKDQISNLRKKLNAAREAAGYFLK